MRPSRRPIALVAAFVSMTTQACAAFQPVGAVPIAPSQQVRIETSGSPLVLQWRPTAGKPPIAECQAAAVKGVLSGVSGDTLRFSQVLSVTQVGEGRSTCWNRMRAMVVLEPGGRDDLKIRRFHGPLSLFAIGVLAWVGIAFEQAWRP